ncbi:class D beta-lactamase [Aerophototrophica crusticola]|uniref:Beta-lactamase n=1 Tax=Aerophototrophica crusticola TaxID=1709002 RepID=A0A858R8F6_9PROT|nr:class D beta-lactamase [Rhodospirillaceae bacterium B3]
MLLALLLPWPAAASGSQLACSLLVDAADGAVLDRSGPDCDRPNSPASTFKIPLALMGLESGQLQDSHAPALPYKPEYPAWRDAWKTTTDPAYWMKESVVWYSQELTKRLGMDAFQAWVDRLDYGNRDLSGDPGQGNGLTRAWLSSSLRISPAGQAAFLRRLVRGDLPVSAETVRKTEALLRRDDLPGGWTSFGKTGAGSLPGPDGKPDPNRPFGWYVGWARKGDRTLVFVRLVKDDARSDTPASFRARDALLAELPGLLGKADAP